MRSTIPKKVRELLMDDPYMVWCAIDNAYCNGRIEWHHAFTYAGKRQNEPWCIIPLCHFHHHNVAAYKRIVDDEIRARIVHFEAGNDFKEKYPRSILLDTHEGKKVELIYVAKEGFRNELPQVKRGRPKSTS